MTLDAEDIEPIARRVVELLADTESHGIRLVDAAELARRLSVERDWVYAHARELGAIRLGGRQGRLRFDLVEVRRRLTVNAPESHEPDRRAARGGTRSVTADAVELLPYEQS
ncbi:hypothetical protein HJD18_16330 [Thermoleophilia bacterium SCSIO 60948]|nr:hypothetical protein HJD18_16330 [Thermoleophilia bacterium SCSIO 60948]